MEWYKTSMLDSELQHAGIKGMKWGVRRFQNEDGTWTEAGKKRYGKDSSAKTASKSKDEGLHDPSSVRSSPSEVKQKQLAKRETASGKWKSGSISSRLDENARQTAINQGDFSAWYGGSYQEIREDLSTEELMTILMNALDNDILAKYSTDPNHWEYQLDNDLKFYIATPSDTSSEAARGERWDEERQIWNAMIDELKSDPKYKKQLEDIRGEMNLRKIESYINNNRSTPHTDNPNGVRGPGKGVLELNGEDIEAMKSIPITRWAEAPDGSYEKYLALRNEYEYNQEKEYNSKKNGFGHSDGNIWYAYK